jgi:hypothetical protein
MDMNRGKLILALAVAAAAAYKFLDPYFAETNRMREEIKKTELTIRELKDNAMAFSPEWEKKMVEKETRLQKEVPDIMDSALVLDYFLTKFEEKNRGKIQFMSVTHQSGVSDIKMTVDKTKVSPRISRYKIKALVMQNAVVPYLEHSQKFSGLLTLEGFNLIVPATGGPLLEMEAVLAFYLMPKEWVPPEKLLEQNEPVVALSALDEQSWFSIFSSKSKAPVTPERAVPQTPVEQYPKFKVDQIVGEGIVVDEILYEEGDTIQGWKVLHIQEDGKSVLLKKGPVTRRVEAP